MTLYEIINIFVNIDKNLVLNKKKFKGLTKQLPVDKIDFQDLSYHKVKKYIDDSIPLIITGIPNEFITDFKNYSLVENVLNNPKNNIILNQYFFPKIPKFKNFIKKYIRKTIISMIQLNGNYESGKAHIDFVSSYNIYYLHKGEKKVIIVPEQCTNYLDMNIGIDNVYVKDDINTNNRDDWLKKIPSYWSFILKQNEILLFNNSKCIHKFKNICEQAEAFSIRVYHSDSSHLIRRNGILNLNSAYHFSKIITNKNLLREQNKMN
jgi:hypothetical protein